MKIYMVTYQNSNEGFCLEWYGSKREAQKAIARLKRDDIAQAKIEYDKDPEAEAPDYRCQLENSTYRITKHDIPTHKDGLLQWLNLYLDRDNG